MPHTSLTKSKADTLGLFLRKVAASASRTICDFGTRGCRAVASRCALIFSGILQVIVVMPLDNTELHIEQYLNQNRSAPSLALCGPPPPPHRRCAASARRKGSLSFRGSSSLELCRRNNFLGERFETRVAMKWSKRRIDPNCGDVIAVVFAITFFEPIDRLVLIAQTEANQSK